MVSSSVKAILVGLTLSLAAGCGLSLPQGDEGGDESAVSESASEDDTKRRKRGDGVQIRMQLPDINGLSLTEVRNEGEEADEESEEQRGEQRDEEREEKFDECEGEDFSDDDTFPEEIDCEDGFDEDEEFDEEEYDEEECEDDCEHDCDEDCDEEWDDDDHGDDEDEFDGEQPWLWSECDGSEDDELAERMVLEILLFGEFGEESFKIEGGCDGDLIIGIEGLEDGAEYALYAVLYIDGEAAYEGESEEFEGGDDSVELLMERHDCDEDDDEDDFEPAEATIVEVEFID